MNSALLCIFLALVEAVKYLFHSTGSTPLGLNLVDTYFNLSITSEIGPKSSRITFPAFPNPFAIGSAT